MIKDVTKKVATVEKLQAIDKDDQDMTTYLPYAEALRSLKKEVLEGKDILILQWPSGFEESVIPARWENGLRVRVYDKFGCFRSVNLARCKKVRVKK